MNSATDSRKFRGHEN